MSITPTPVYRKKRVLKKETPWGLIKRIFVSLRDEANSGIIPFSIFSEQERIERGIKKFEHVALERHKITEKISKLNNEFCDIIERGGSPDRLDQITQESEKLVKELDKLKVK